MKKMSSLSYMIALLNGLQQQQFKENEHLIKVDVFNAWEDFC